ncbi:hypothetical protein [Kordia sp.]|uniref:hypothetical protein n=1 Tax=Kordia sp. TaxID=1965332 RepID=UPI003D6B85C9
MKKLGFLFISLILLGCNGTPKKENTSIATVNPKDCIKQIFEKDSVFGHIRNYDSEKASVTEAINNYVKNAKTLDFSNCPEGFETAFKKHVDAWLNFRKVSDKHPTLRGELHEIFAMIEKTEDSIVFKSSLKQIFDTWTVVKEASK